MFLKVKIAQGYEQCQEIRKKRHGEGARVRIYVIHRQRKRNKSEIRRLGEIRERGALILGPLRKSTPAAGHGRQKIGVVIYGRQISARF